MEWVLEYERRSGRQPTDRRHMRGFPGDIESPPRVIEIKAAATSSRGTFLWLEPIQFEHARTNPDFYLYLVENVGQGDPAKFTLRILASEQLQQMSKRTAERRHYEVSWPTRVYDATPIVAMPDEAGRMVPEPRGMPSPPSTTQSTGGASTAAEAIREALETLGGEAQASDIKTWIEIRYPGRWKDIRTDMADLTFPGSASSKYATERRFLERVTRGRYRLRR